MSTDNTPKKAPWATYKPIDPHDGAGESYSKEQKELNQSKATTAKQQPAKTLQPPSNKKAERQPQSPSAKATTEVTTTTNGHEAYPKLYMAPGVYPQLNTGDYPTLSTPSSRSNRSSDDSSTTATDRKHRRKGIESMAEKKGLQPLKRIMRIGYSAIYGELPAKRSSPERTNKSKRRPNDDIEAASDDEVADVGRKGKTKKSKRRRHRRRVLFPLCPHSAEGRCLFPFCGRVEGRYVCPIILLVVANLSVLLTFALIVAQRDFQSEFRWFGKRL